MSEFICPECSAHSRRIMGHEVRGVYDGILYWSCMDCGFAWSRDWTGFGRRSDIAASMVASHNAPRPADRPTPGVGE